MSISLKTSESLDLLVGKAFDLNRSFDRAVSIMQNKWCMPNASDIIHHNLAHLFPLLADIISGFKDSWNLTTVYPETHEDKRDYANLLNMMTILWEEVLDYYEMIKMVYKIAEEEGDFNVMAMLIDFMGKLTVVVSQVYTLKDKAEQMPTDWDKFDNWEQASPITFVQYEDWNTGKIDWENPNLKLKELDLANKLIVLNNIK